LKVSKRVFGMSASASGAGSSTGAGAQPEAMAIAHRISKVGFISRVAKGERGAVGVRYTSQAHLKELILMKTLQPANGKLAFQDSTLHVWNDDVDTHIQSVNTRVKSYLRAEGWALQIDPATKKNYPTIAKNHTYGRQGDLELMMRLCGRHLEIVLYQNVANVKNPHGNLYDFDKMARMPYLLKKQAELTRFKLESLLMTEFGYAAAARETPRPGVNGSTALEFVEHRIATSGHFKPALGRADYSGDYNRKSRDGALLEHGMPVYFRDRKGRWATGTAYYNLNNMWWVVTGKYGWANVACFELHTMKPASLRIKENTRLALKQLNALVESAVQAKNFLKAHALQSVLAKLLTPVEAPAKTTAA
jgi:hypothetical protein